MATSDFFADTYAAAREKFLTAAGAARCDVSSYRLPSHVGPRDEELTVVQRSLVAPPEVRQVLELTSLKALQRAALDVYVDLFDEDLDSVAANLDAAIKSAAYPLRTHRTP